MRWQAVIINHRGEGQRRKRGKEEGRKAAHVDDSRRSARARRTDCCGCASFVARARARAARHRVVLFYGRNSSRRAGSAYRDRRDSLSSFSSPDLPQHFKSLLSRSRASCGRPATHARTHTCSRSRATKHAARIPFVSVSILSILSFIASRAHRSQSEKRNGRDRESREKWRELHLRIDETL